MISKSKFSNRQTNIHHWNPFKICTDYFMNMQIHHSYANMRNLLKRIMEL